MDELYIVYDDNYGSVTDRIQFAFICKEKAEEYAKKQNEINGDINEYFVGTIYLLNDESK